MSGSYLNEGNVVSGEMNTSEGMTGRDFDFELHLKGSWWNVQSEEQAHFRGCGRGNSVPSRDESYKGLKGHQLGQRLLAKREDNEP